MSMNYLKCKKTKKEREKHREMKIIPFRSQEPRESRIKVGAVNINDELFAKGSSFPQKKNPTVGPQQRYNLAL